MVLIASRAIGNAGRMEIHDNGVAVQMRIRSSDSQTYSGAIPFRVYVNGAYRAWSSVSYSSGSPWVNVFYENVNSSQTVAFTIGATGTWGFGNGGELQAWVARATVPPAPAPIGIDQVTADSFRYRFSSTGDGGAAVVEWQIQLATNAAFTTGLRNISSSGTSTITGLNNHTAYWVRSRGRNSKGWGAYSAARSTTTLGHPTAPLTPVATPSTSVTGRIALSWTAPATPGAGGIVGYNIYRAGVQIATTTGTGTTYTDTGRTPYTSYSYTIAARNAYSTSVSGVGPQSASVSAIAPGPPSAPRTLTGVSSTTVPGEVLLSWVAPLNTGAGGITGYRVRLADGTLVATITGTATTRTVTGLTPGLQYTFKVSALNALATTEGSESAFSNQVIVTPIGEPTAPTGVTVTRQATTPNRLVISWTATPGSISGYNVFERVNGADTLIGSINATHTSFTHDGLVSGSAHTYVVRARTIYTDTLNSGYPGNWGGPASAPASNTASANAVQSVSSLSAVTSATNAIFNGTYIINAITATTVKYAKVAANIAGVASGGTITNNTNTTFNGTYTVATPTPTTITYAKTASNIAPLSVSGGVVNNLTNLSLSGVFTVTAVNVGANLLSYASTGADFASVAVPTNAPPGQSGSVVNRSNAIFNGVNRIITAITEYTFTYNQVNANVPESNAAGTVTNTTNRDVFNGLWTVSSIPAYNIVRYARTAANVALRTWFEPNGRVFRDVSPSTLDVRFRSGWSG